MRWLRLGLAVIIAIALIIPIAPEPAAARTSIAELGAAASGPANQALRIEIQPAQIKVGRDVKLTVRVIGAAGRLVPGAVVSITGDGLPVVGTAAQGELAVTVHAVAVGSMLVKATGRGYAVSKLEVPVVPGPPATVAAIKVGLNILPPASRPLRGRIGDDLVERDHAVTGNGQFASLALRDGSLVDLNTNTDVTIKDPLHITLSSGELFIEVIHGEVSHIIQAGSAVAATKGTRLDIQTDPKTHTTMLAVIEGDVLLTNNGKSVLVGTGEQSVVPANQAPQQPQDVSMGAVVSWVQNVPNTDPSTVPPVLNIPHPSPVHPVLKLPQPRPALIALPSPSQTATMTATSPAQARWSGVVYVPNSVTVPTTGTLTIDPGTTVLMARGSSLADDGTLLANGSATSPITFTSAAEQPQPGDWGGITINGTASSQSVLTHVQSFYGSQSGSGQGMLDVTGGASPTIGDSVLARATRNGIWVDDVSRPTISNCVFGADAAFAVSVSAEGAGLVTASQLGAGQAGIEIRDTPVSRATTWQRQDASYYLDGATVIAGAGLTIAPGTVIHMARGATLHVQGTLLAKGSPDAPIIFTSQAAVPAAGDWNDIVLDGTGSSGSVLENLDVYAGGASRGTNGMLSVIDGSTPAIVDSVFAESGGYGIWVDNASRPTISHCVFSDDGELPISLPADDAARITGTELDVGEDGIEVRNTAITHDGTWHEQDAPFVLEGGTVNAGVTLAMARGTYIRMADLASFKVLGTLAAQGTATAPVIITSNEDDPAPGDWKAVDFVGTGTNQSVLNNVWLSYGSRDNGGGMLSAFAGAAPIINNSVFAQAEFIGVWADDHSRPHLSNCAFAAGGAVAISVPADGMRWITGTSVGPNQQGIEIRDTLMRHTATWHFQPAPLIVDGGMVGPNVTLSIDPGVMLRMAEGATFKVQGVLRALGTTDAPIVVTSNSSEPAAGNWNDFILDGKIAGMSVLRHVQFSFGGVRAAGGAVLSILHGAKPSVAASTFAQSRGDGIWADATSRPTIIACSFVSLGGPSISVPSADTANVRDNVFAAGQQGVELRAG